MESSGNAEKTRKKILFCGEDDSMQNSIFFLVFAGNEPKSVMEQVFGDCRDNLRSIWKAL